MATRADESDPDSGRTSPPPSAGVFERLGTRLADVVERWMPSPFLFAILLSYVVFVAGIVLGDDGVGPGDMIEFWYGGFWGFLAFAMQMVLILMTGFVIAYHPRVNGLLRRLTQIPNDGRQAVVLVGVFSMMIAWIHWGFSLILGAIFAREMGKTARQNGVDVHYPLLCVAGYMGLGLTWHWGLSGSAPLLLNTPGNEFLEAGIVESIIPASETIFSPYALALTVLSIVFAAAMLALLAPGTGRARGIEEFVPNEQLTGSGAVDGTDVAADGGGVDERTAGMPAEKIDNSRLLGLLIAVAGVGVVGYTLATQGLDGWNLNLVNFAFLFAGLLVYLRPAVYRERFGEAAEAAAGIILLFPFFAGIQGMMNESGLSQSIAEGLFAISTPEVFPAVAWIAGAIVNLFVPSGGGEWIVLGPSVVEAAQSHGVPVGQATIAYAVGDAHTNLFNPFWALPLLAITGIRAREMFGYAIAMMLLLTPFLALALILVPY